MYDPCDVQDTSPCVVLHIFVLVHQQIDAGISLMMAAYALPARRASRAYQTLLGTI